VEQPASRRIELIVLEHCMVSAALALEDDVEDRMQAVIARQRLPQFALLDAEGVRVIAVPVEDSGDESARAKTPRGGAAAQLAFLDVQPDALVRHSGGQV
jgi:hypothetical protein